MDIGLNEHHQQNVVNYLRFTRFNCNQRLRSVQACFKELKDSRLVDDTYTLDEVTDMLDELCAVVKGEVDSELINLSHTNVLLLRQLFTQAEKWHLKLQADISELENRELIEEIATFEEREFSSVKSTAQGKLSKLSLSSKLEPLNEGGGNALLQMHGDMSIMAMILQLSERELLAELIQDQQKEISRLNEENVKLRDRLKDLESKATNVLGEKSKLQSDLHQTQAQLRAKGNTKGSDRNVSYLEEEMASVRMDLKKTNMSQAATLEEELANCKHEILRLQHELEKSDQELTKRFSETTQYKNMKQMLASKNDQLKDLRGRLRRYEPDA